MKETPLWGKRIQGSDIAKMQPTKGQKIQIPKKNAEKNHKNPLDPPEKCRKGRDTYKRSQKMQNNAKKMQKMPKKWKIEKWKRQNKIMHLEFLPPPPCFTLSPLTNLLLRGGGGDRTPCLLYLQTWEPDFWMGGITIAPKKSEWAKKGDAMERGPTLWHRKWPRRGVHSFEHTRNGGYWIESFNFLSQRLLDGGDSYPMWSATFPFSPQGMGHIRCEFTRGGEGG